jgi:hypothetical protein
MTWAPDYLTVEQLAARMRIPDGVDDDELALAISAASRAVDSATGRQFGKTTGPVEARYYTARWSARYYRWLVLVDDFQTSVGLLVATDPDDDGTYEALVDEYQLKPVNNAAKGHPWTAIMVHPRSTVQPDCTPDGVEVRATWGWTDIPDVVIAATGLQAIRFASRRDSPYGIAGSPDTGGGGELRLLDKVDPDVAVMLKPVTRYWWAR